MPKTGNNSGHSSYAHCMFETRFSITYNIEIVTKNILGIINALEAHIAFHCTNALCPPWDMSPLCFSNPATHHVAFVLLRDCDWSKYGHVQFGITGCWKTRRASHAHPNASSTLPVIRKLMSHTASCAVPSCWHFNFGTYSYHIRMSHWPSCIICIMFQKMIVNMCHIAPLCSHFLPILGHSMWALPVLRWYSRT